MKYSRWIFTLLAIFSFFSCDLFLSPPRMRENVNDPNRQITAFTAVPLGNTSILTMWNWKPPQDQIDPDGRIEEIKIIHSTLGYPDVNIPFAGKTFTDDSVWKQEWTGLKADTTHYFSLFAKDAGGNWHSSYKIKVMLPGIKVVKPLSVDNIWKVSDSPFITSGVTFDAVNISNVFVIALQPPDNLKVKSAVINPSATLGLKTASSDNFRVMPLSEPFNEIGDTSTWNQVGYFPGTPPVEYIVEENLVATFPGTNNVFNTEPLDITTQVQKALVSGSNQLVIHSEGSNIIFTIDYTDFLIIEYYE